MWWLILAGYAVPMIGGVAWTGRGYALGMARIEDEEWTRLYVDNRQEHLQGKTMEAAVIAIFWPLVLIAIVLYYVIASPFLIGEYLGRREAEQTRALRSKYTEQADYLQLLAKDEDDGVMQDILRSGADALRQQARDL